MNAQLQPTSAFDILAIVTSAGGLEAMSAVLSDLSADFACAVIVGQHLGAESALMEILATRTLLPVQWVSHGERLHAGRIHVVPPLMQLEVMPDFDELIEILDAAGRRVRRSFNAAPIRDPNGRITGGVVLFRDVSGGEPQAPTAPES